MRTPFRFALASAALVLAPGCSVSSLVGAHQPLRPLLDHEGQLDVSVHGGLNSETTSSLGAQVAYAPTSGFEIAGALDADVADGEQYPNRHFGGGVAVGWFLDHETLRLEGFVGVNGGWGEGSSDDTAPVMTGGGSAAPRPTFRLESSYVQPFVQGMIGFEVPYFEMAGGGRLWGHLAEVWGTPITGPENDGYERAFIEPMVTVRVPIDWFRIETTITFVVPIGGDYVPLPAAGWEDGYQYALTFGFGMQLDTIEPPQEAVPSYAY